MLLQSLLVHHHSLGLKNRPHLISSRALTHYFSFLVLFLVAISITRAKAPEILGFATSINIEGLLAETNSARLENGVKEVEMNDLLSVSAEKKAEDMFKYNYWSHTSPSGVQPWDFILGENYDYIYAGENLARDFSTSKGVVDAWLDSPSHRENLLNPKYMQMGLAVVNGNLDGIDTTLVVQLFGTPRQSLATITESTSDEVLSETMQSVLVIEDNKKVENIENSFESGVKRQPQVMQLDLLKSKAPIDNALINISVSTQNLVMYFATLLLVLFVIDAMFVYANRYDKHTGHSEVHILYILFIIIGVLIVRAGGIL